MVFYKTKRTSFVTILSLTIISWALMLSYYIYSSYIGLDTMILPIVFVLVSIFFYRDCYIKNIKYVVNNLGIESYDSKNNLLSKNMWSEHYKVERVILGKNNIEQMF